MWMFEKYYKTPKILFSKLLKLTGSSRYQLATQKKKKKKKKKKTEIIVFSIQKSKCIIFLIHLLMLEMVIFQQWVLSLGI